MTKFTLLAISALLLSTQVSFAGSAAGENGSKRVVTVPTPTDVSSCAKIRRANGVSFLENHCNETRSFYWKSEKGKCGDFSWLPPHTISIAGGCVTTLGKKKGLIIGFDKMIFLRVATEDEVKAVTEAEAEKEGKKKVREEERKRREESNANAWVQEVSDFEKAKAAIPFEKLHDQALEHLRGKQSKEQP